VGVCASFQAPFFCLLKETQPEKKSFDDRSSPKATAKLEIHAVGCYFENRNWM